MKNLFMAVLCLSAINVQADFDFDFRQTLPGGIDYPDWDRYERDMENHRAKVRQLRDSDAVTRVVAKVEEKYNTTCTEYNRGESKLFRTYKLPYNCEGESNFALIVKAKFKKGVAVVKKYYVK